MRDAVLLAEPAARVNVEQSRGPPGPLLQVRGQGRDELQPGCGQLAAEPEFGRRPDEERLRFRGIESGQPCSIPALEPVAARGAADGDDRDAGFREGLSVALHRPLRDSEQLGEFDRVQLPTGLLVRAAEGVPRDAINIAAKAAIQARDRKISVPDIRRAARAWFQHDKEANLGSRAEALSLLNWVIDKVIREKRARAFLVKQRSAKAPLLMALFDARVLHLARKGYSGQDEPGKRYDVYNIDYGAYVDLITTKNEPQGALPLNGDDGQDAGYVDVPPQDLRAIRRAVLDLDEFEATTGSA